MADATKAENPRVRKPLTQERLMELLHYDPVTGVFRWIGAKVGRAKNNSIAGTRTRRGYRYISIDQKKYLEHRVAWLYVHGLMPSEIDHIDCCPDNNSISNLRQCSHSENNANSRKQEKGSLPYKGLVKKACGSWQASIQRLGKRYYLGTFDTAERASQAYYTAAEKLFGEFARRA